MKSFVPTRECPYSFIGRQERLRKVLLGLLVVLLGSFSPFFVKGQSTNFSFTQIASTTEVPAPGRGLQTWIGMWQIAYPTASSTEAGNVFDDYYRFKWHEIQDEAGNFVWSTFDAKVNSAISNGRKFDFAVMPLYSSENYLTVGGSNLTYPTFLHNQMQAESVKDWISPSAGAWIINWNSNSYLTALENMVKAIAAHINSTSFNGIPYSKVINIIDMRGFGNWGEGHTYPWSGEITSAQQLTLASAKRMIDAYLTAFPNNQIVVCHEFFGGDNDGNGPQDPAIGYYALTAKNARGEIGWRRDSWGWQGAWFPGLLEANPTVFNGVTYGSLISNKWKVAPVTGEPMQCCTTDNGFSIYGGLPNDVTKYHVSVFGNGNYESTSDATAIANVRSAGRLTGYRLVLTGGSVPSTLTPGTPFTLNLNWQNLGVAPTYEDWDVYYELRNASNVSVWSGKSAFKPRLFLPAAAATAASDAFTIPSTVASGSYKLVVVVKDPNGYRQPLPLAINGRNTDGSYPLGTVTVGAGGSTTNQAPTANAGAAFTVNLPTSTATLTGTGADADGTISAYAWSQVSGPATATIASPNTASTGLSALVAGTYIFRLTVTDNGGATATADITVTVAVANKAPLVSAGNAISVTLPANTATLTGTATDSDGSIASYAWTKVSGPAGGTISSPTAASTTVTGLVAGAYSFKLTATDNQGATGSATVIVTVSATPNIAPTVTPGAAVTITPPTSTTSISGTASDADGTIASYAWTQVSGPVTATIATPSAATTTLSGLTTSGTYVFKLTATDNGGAAASGNVTVTVNAGPNVAPTANAGTDITITLPTSTTTLTGSGKDSDGTIAAYSWTKVSGPAGGTIASPKSAASNITGLVAGIYVFRLTVTDDRGATATANVTVTVNAVPTANVAPTANAGANVTITLPTSTVTVNGTGTDSDGSIASYSWSQLSGPSASTIAKPASAGTDITNLVAGTYTFRLTVTDNGGLTATSDVQVTVNSAPTNNSVNRLPVANAGADQTLTLPTSSTTLSGSASSDPDGSISAYSWSQLSGPGTANIGSATSASTSISNLVKGTYQFELKVWDDKNATSSVKVLVIVTDANQKAVIQLASDTVTVTLPTSNTELNASASYDPDGTIASYAWSYVSGPGAPDILAPGASKTTVNNLAAGTYVFNLAVTDNKGAVSNRNAVVIVSYSNTRVAAQALAIYPNPVQSAATISLNSDMEGKAAYQVTDMNGNPVMAGQFTKISGAQTIKVDMTHLRSGIYFLKLQVNDVRLGVKKIMKL